jgi:hypothetical protein
MLMPLEFLGPQSQETNREFSEGIREKLSLFEKQDKHRNRNTEIQKMKMRALGRGREAELPSQFDPVQ